MANYSEKLEGIRRTWDYCNRCELANRRNEVGGPVVHGTGSRRGIMFVGEGPGATEETEGKPFKGVSGKLLRRTIRALGITRFFLSNIVACRCCEQKKDDNNKPMFKRRWVNGHPINSDVPLLEDKAPTIPCVQACLPRLYEEILAVDPKLIVALGASAAKALTGKHIAITDKRGEVEGSYVPSNGLVMSLTEKKGVWVRPSKKEWIQPVLPFMVGYATVLTFHPSYVHRNSEDRRPGNPTEKFVKDMIRAKHIFNAYNEIGFNIQPPEHEILNYDPDLDIHDEAIEEAEDGAQE